MLHELRDRRSLHLLITKLAVFFTSFELIRPFEFLLTLSDMLFMLAFVMMIAIGRIPRHPYGTATTIFLALFSLMILSMVISSFIGGGADRAAAFVIQYAFAYVVLAYILAAEDYAEVVALVRWYLAGLAIGLLITFYWFWFEPTPNYFVSGNGRLMGWKNGANGQAVIIALSLPLLYCLWLRKQWPLMLLIPVSLILAYGLIATSSNSGLMAAIFGALLFFVMTITFGRAIKAIVVMAVVASLVASFGLDYLPQIFQDRVLTAVESGNLDEAGTFSDRVDLIVEALDLIDDTIFLGLGADQFRHHSASGLPVHSTYLLLWTEGGLICMIGWVGMIITIAMLGLTILRTADGGIQGATAIAISATVLVVAIGSTHLYARTYVMPIILALGLVISTQRMLAYARAPLRTHPRPAAQQPVAEEQLLSGDLQ
ncbi:MAG: O-antigen ligase family protein [Alphaproteobacteria bacterium]|nr:O-antigen ligase family protein [Alphaproteobacteria bacterium]